MSDGARAGHTRTALRILDKHAKSKRGRSCCRPSKILQVSKMAIDSNYLIFYFRVLYLARRRSFHNTLHVTVYVQQKLKNLWNHPAPYTESEQYAEHPSILTLTNRYQRPIPRDDLAQSSTPNLAPSQAPSFDFSTRQPSKKRFRQFTRALEHRTSQKF